MYRPRHAPLPARRRPSAGPRVAVAAGVVVLAAVVASVVLVTGGGHRVSVRTGSRRPPPRPAGSATTTPATTAAASTATTSALPSASDASQPQTSDQPTTNSPAFNAEMAALWTGITTDQPDTAMAAFFPEAAYAQVKTYWDDNTDWTGRLVAHYRLDISAAHDELGAGAAGAVLTQVIVPTSGVEWVQPRVCDNRVGYWHVGGARLVYQEGGQERSIGIASLISWRGNWYVVHLGSVTPPDGQGVVASPSSGTGDAGGYAGC